MNSDANRIMLTVVALKKHHIMMIKITVMTVIVFLIFRLLVYLMNTAGKPLPLYWTRKMFTLFIENFK
jgi:hypothetical protein